MGFVMLAGAGANLEQQFGLPAWAGSAVCAGLVILTAFLDFDRIMEVIGVFTPMIVIAIIVLVIYSLVTPHPSMAELNATATQVTPALPNLWFSTINYFALCVVNGIGMAFVLGGSVLRIGEARLAGRIGGTIIALVIGGDALALYLNMDRIWDVNVPALEIARTIHPWFAFVYTLIIFALIYNTVVLSCFRDGAPFLEWLDKAYAHRARGRRCARIHGVAHGLQEADRRHVSDHRLAGRRAPGGPGCGLVARARGRLARGEATPQAHSPSWSHKHADHLEYTDEHRDKVRELSRASVVDSKQLRRDASTLAKDIVDRKANASPSDLVTPRRGEAVVTESAASGRANG